MKRILLTGVAMAAIGYAMPAVATPRTACALSDVSLTIGTTTYSPTKCADNVANGNPTAETATMNTTLATTGYIFLAKSNDTTDLGALGGVNFAVTAPATNSGAWQISWSEASGAPNLPLIMNIEVGLFGGNNGSDYLLTNVLFPTSPTSGSGTFDINFLNGGGQQPALSHLTLTGGDVREVSSPVPEPISLAVFGAGMFGLGLARRLKKTI